MRLNRLGCRNPSQIQHRNCRSTTLLSSGLLIWWFFPYKQCRIALLLPKGVPTPSSSSTFNIHLKTRLTIPLKATRCPMPLCHQTHFDTFINKRTAKALRKANAHSAYIFACTKVKCPCQQYLATTQLGTAICYCTSKRNVALCLQLPSAIHPPDAHLLNQTRGHPLRTAPPSYAVNASDY